MNLIIKSLKKSKRIISLTEDLKNDKPVDWGNWAVREISELCRFYVEEMTWCDRYDSYLTQYEAFNHAVHKVNEIREDILDLIIEKTEGLKPYMIIHSVFDIDQYDDGDWFAQFMIRKLYPNDELVKRVHTPEKIPEELMRIFRKFKPKPMGFSRYVDNKIIKYKLWRDWEKGVPNDPILVLDRDWDFEDDDVMKEEELTDIISGYDDIVLS